MTIKQFAYVIVGVIFAWIFFSLPVSTLLKLPFSLFSLCFGAALAFLPVEGRPLDIMVTHFFKALLSPNQFLFIKSGARIIPPLPHKNYQPTAKEQSKTISAENLQALLASSGTLTSKNELDQKEALYLQSVSSILNGDTQAIQNQIPTMPISSAPIQPVAEKKEEKTEESIKPEDVGEIEQELEEQTQVLKEELVKEKEEVQKEEAGEGNDKTVQEENQRIAKLEQLLNETISQKNALEQQLLSLQKQFEVKKPPKDTIKSTKLPIIEQNPNLISGIIKDSRGNVLPNILVEIRDQEQNPVRAFKTNQLGQFASATPLLNGTYALIFEDPSEKHKFESLEIIANGEFIPPLAIASIDAREELRKSLFNN